MVEAAAATETDNQYIVHYYILYVCLLYDEWYDEWSLKTWFSL